MRAHDIAAQIEPEKYDRAPSASHLTQQLEVPRSDRAARSNRRFGRRVPAGSTNGWTAAARKVVVGGCGTTGAKSTQARAHGERRGPRRQLAPTAAGDGPFLAPPLPGAAVPMRPRSASGNQQNVAWWKTQLEMEHSRQQQQPPRARPVSIHSGANGRPDAWSSEGECMRRIRRPCITPPKLRCFATSYVLRGANSTPVSDVSAHCGTHFRKQRSLGRHRLRMHLRQVSMLLPVTGTAVAHLLGLVVHAAHQSAEVAF